MRISDWSSDVCSSDLLAQHLLYAAVGMVEAVDRQRLHEDAVDGVARMQRPVRVLEHHLHQLVEGLVAPRALPLPGDGDAAAPVGIEEIGRASCRERVCQYVSMSVVAVSLKKKKLQPSQIIYK